MRITSGKMDVVERFAEITKLMLLLSQKLTEQQIEAIDQQFVPRQHELI